jgi:hypothetical protein
LPLSMRKTNLACLLARRPDGIFVAPFEQGEIGPDLFRAACNMGLEGLVSKRADPLSRRTVEGLDQSQEPQAPGDGARQRLVLTAAQHRLREPAPVFVGRQPLGVGGGRRSGRRVLNVVVGVAPRLSNPACLVGELDLDQAHKVAHSKFQAS